MVKYALLLLFFPPNVDPIAIPLARDLDFIGCQIERELYLEQDKETLGIVMCFDQSKVDLPSLSGTE